MFVALRKNVASLAHCDIQKLSSSSDGVLTCELDILYPEAWDTLRFMTQIIINTIEATKNTLVVFKLIA